MRNVKRLVIAAITGTFMFSAVGCGMIQKTDAAIQGTVVAKVNGEKITLGEVDKELEDLGFYSYLEQTSGPDYKEQPDAQEYIAQQRGLQLDNLITNKVLIAKANELKLVPTEEEIKTEVQKLYDDMKARIEGAGGNFAEEMDKAGFTEETYRAALREQVIGTAAIDYMVKDVTVTDEEVKSYYDENKDSFQNYGEAETRHLLFDTEEKAKEASENIKSGKVTFDKLFEEYKDNKAKGDEGHGEEGHEHLPIAEDLGVVSHGEQNFDPAFLEGLKPLKEGEVSGPVKSSFGYHIIEAKKVKDTTPQEFDEVKEQIKATITSKKEQEATTTTLEQWKKDLGVKTYEDKLKENF